MNDFSKQDLSARLEQIEILLSFQQDNLEQIQNQMHQQVQQINQLKQQYVQLKQWLQGNNVPLSTVVAHEQPPHY